MMGSNNWMYGAVISWDMEKWKYINTGGEQKSSILDIGFVKSHETTKQECWAGERFLELWGKFELHK